MHFPYNSNEIKYSFERLIQYLIRTPYLKRNRKSQNHDSLNARSNHRYTVLYVLTAAGHADGGVVSIAAGAGHIAVLDIGTAHQHQPVVTLCRKLASGAQTAGSRGTCVHN